MQVAEKRSEAVRKGWKTRREKGVLSGMNEALKALWESKTEGPKIPAPFVGVGGESMMDIMLGGKTLTWTPPPGVEPLTYGFHKGKGGWEEKQKIIDMFSGEDEVTVTVNLVHFEKGVDGIPSITETETRDITFDPSGGPGGNFESAYYQAMRERIPEKSGSPNAAISVVSISS
jgi:hypothetical protein